MSERRKPDWTRTGTVAGYAEWLRKQSGALGVLVVRVNDAVFAVDPGLAPADARDLIVDRAIELARDVDAARQEKRPAARLEMEAVRE